MPASFQLIDNTGPTFIIPSFFSFLCKKPTHCLPCKLNHQLRGHRQTFYRARLRSTSSLCPESTVFRPHITRGGGNIKAAVEVCNAVCPIKFGDPFSIRAYRQTRTGMRKFRLPVLKACLRDNSICRTGREASKIVAAPVVFLSGTT